MIKYYRVKKDNFLWKEGAILTDEGKGQYSAIQDIWDNNPCVGEEYISSRIIEHPDSSEYFERVYPDTFKGNIYRTKDKLVEIYRETFN